MPTTEERVQTPWPSGDPFALCREVEKIAAEGYARPALEDILLALQLRVREAGPDEDTDEIINGMVDRLTG